MKDGLFVHYERSGIGYAVEFSEDGLNLEHNFLYDFHLDISNILGYRNLISTKGILTDFTTPEPGKVHISRVNLDGRINSDSDIGCFIF